MLDREVVISHVPIPRSMLIVAAIVAEVAVALLLKEAQIFGLVHAAAIGTVGIYGALRRDLTIIICAIAYLTGTEVLWRQTRVPVFYLTAPYLVIGLSVFAVIFVLGHLGRDARLAVLYGALLLPATVATIRTAGPNAREFIAFALSGPIALASFVSLTSQVRIARDLYRQVLWILLISAVGPLTIAISDMRADLASQGSIEFSTQSNFATSGGFGPVQVSAALSMGMVAAVLLIIIENNRLARAIAGFIAFVLAVQTLLTFSRGGSFSLLITLAVLAVTQARDPRVRNRILVVALTGLALAYFLVFPWLETFTDGMFGERFSDTKSARTELASNDTQIFARNWVFGVGPGMTKYQRLTYEICEIRTDRCRNEASSHTEFTRTLSEHGLPGLVAIVLLVTMAWHAFRRAGPGRQFAVAWMAWSIAQMFYANLRIVAVPVAFGLAFLRFIEHRSSTDGEPDEDHTDGNVEAEAAPLANRILPGIEVHAPAPPPYTGPELNGTYTGTLLNGSSNGAVQQDHDHPGEHLPDR